MLWESCSKSNLEQLSHSMFCKNICTKYFYFGCYIINIHQITTNIRFSQKGLQGLFDFGLKPNLALTLSKLGPKLVTVIDLEIYVTSSPL